MKYRVTITIDVETPSGDYKAAALDYVGTKLASIISTNCPVDVAIRGASIDKVMEFDSPDYRPIAGIPRTRLVDLAAPVKAAPSLSSRGACITRSLEWR